MIPNKIKATAAAGLGMALPYLALAQSAIPVPNVGLPGSSGATITSMITSIITGILLPIAGIIAVLFIIIGGYQYMFAGTNEKLAEKGKLTIRNAVFGLIIIILSYVVITIVVNTLSGTNFRP